MLHKGRHATRSTARRVAALRACASLFVAAGAWSLYLAAEASTSASAATLGGTATITDQSGNTLTSGGSTTIFTVALPAQAACSGDTQKDGYHVFSFLVQQGTDPTSVSFSSGDPSVGYGFFSSDGTLYVAANTAPTTGQIIEIPDFEWGPAITSDSLLSDLLYTGGTSGAWEGGIACANSSGTVTDYWSAQITFTKSSSDPDGFVWTATSGGSGTTTTTGASGSTTTTTGGSDTTTTTGGSGTTTTTGASGTTATTGSQSSSGAAALGSTDDDSGSTGGATGGTLAETGFPAIRDFSIGLLFIGLGLTLLGLSVRAANTRRRGFAR
jgi:hypothetical protein